MELWLQCPWLSTLYWEKRYFLRFLPAFYLLHQSFSLPFPTMTITWPLALKLFHSWYFFADSWCVTSKGSARLRTFLLPWVSGTQLKKQTKNNHTKPKNPNHTPHPPTPKVKASLLLLLTQKQISACKWTTAFYWCHIFCTWVLCDTKNATKESSGIQGQKKKTRPPKV